MADPSFVGFTTLNETRGSTPETFSIALPSGSQVGDTIILWVSGEASQYNIDTRLTSVNNGWFGSPEAYAGVATTLADIDVEITSSVPVGLAYVMVLRDAPLDVRGFYTYPDGSYYPRLTDQISSEQVAEDSESYLYSDGAVFAVTVAADGSSISTPTLGTDPDGDWTALDELARTYTNAFGTFDFAMRGYWYGGGNPVPELDPSGTSSRRQAITFYWQPGPQAVADRYLRQRQSPRGTPSRMSARNL